MSTTPQLAFSHVGIFVHDLALMEDFYTRVLGFSVTDRGVVAETRKIVFLSRDPREHHQIVLATGRPGELGFNILNQISFRVDSLATLRHFHHAVSGERISEMRPISHGLAWSIYFRDPEGNRIEIFCDTPWYVRQPLLEPLDLSLPDEEILARTEAMCRKLPDFKTQDQWRNSMVRLMSAEAAK